MNERRLHPFRDDENDRGAANYTEESIEDVFDGADRFRRQFPGKFIKFRTFERSSDFLASLDMEGRVRTMRHARDLWCELSDPEGKYAIPMPRTDYVIGYEPPYQLEQSYNPHRPDTRPGYYSVSEEVIGTPLAEEIARPDSLVTDEALTHLFATLGSYYLDKLQQGGDFVVDMKIDQFMYGHLKDDSGNMRILLVDQEPFYGNLIDDGVSASGGFNSLRAQAYQIAKMIIDTEEIRGVTFADAREVVLQLLDALPPHPAPLMLNGGVKYDPGEKLIAKLQ